MSVRQRIYKKLFCADNFYKSIQPLLFLIFIDGTTPFLVVTNKRGQKTLQSSRWGFVTGLLSVIAFCYCSVYIIYHNESFISQFLKTDVTSYSDKVHVLTGVVGCALVLISGFVHRGKLLRTIQLFAKIDHHFKQIGMLCNFTYILRTVLVMISLTFLCNFVSIAVSFSCWTRMNMFPSPPLIFMLVAEFFGVSFSIALYTFLTITVAVNMRLLHKVLKNLGHQWDNRTMKSITHKQRSLQCLDSFSMYTIVTKDPSDIIQESMEIHHMICDAASTANKYFTYQLLTIISIAFLIIVFDAYYVLETLLGKSKRESKFKTVEFVTFFSCQMVLYLIAIISIVEGSNRAIKKSEKTGGIVHSLLNKTKSAEVKEKLQQFSLQLMHLKINFTAAGLFNIDRTLYFTISGALTTYLIILLQFTSSTSQPLTTEAQVANATLHV